MVRVIMKPRLDSTYTLWTNEALEWKCPGRLGPLERACWTREKKLPSVFEVHCRQFGPLLINTIHCINDKT